eukprot:scaffold17242_cov70-Phaeocystis_antarctica.AAC.1
MVRVDGGDNQLAFTKGCKARTPLQIDILNSPQDCLIRARASAHVCDVGQRGPFLARRERFGPLPRGLKRRDRRGRLPRALE